MQPPPVPPQPININQGDLNPNPGAVDIGKEFIGSASNQTIGGLVSTFLNVAFAVSGVIILFMFVYAGIMMIQGAGSGKTENTEKAKQAATYAAIGFGIIFLAYWLIRLIELITGQNFVTNPTF